MKLTLRNLALSAAIVAAGAVSAQELTVTQNYIHYGLPGDANQVRSGNGVNGKFYVPVGNDIYVIDATTATNALTAPNGANKGLFVDDAGNMLFHNGFPASAANWMNFTLVSADFQTVKDITIAAPTETADDVWAGDRADNAGYAIGDFFSEEGGLCYLTANTWGGAIPVWIANGEQIETEYFTGATGLPKNSTTSYAIPAVSSMADVDEENVKDLFYNVVTNSAIFGVNEDGEAYTLANPDFATLDIEGASVPTQNGFGVFNLGDTKYEIRMLQVGAGTWPCDWIMANAETGEIVYKSPYPADYYTGKTGNGGNIAVRQITPNKVEIYHTYCTNTAEKGFCAMFTAELPEPTPPALPLYLVGQFQGWNPGAPAEFTRGEDGLYTYAYTQDAPGGLKMSTAMGSWDEFNAGVLRPDAENGDVATGNTYNLVESDGNWQIPNGEYTFTVDLEAKTLTITGEAAAFVAPELYLRGDFNSWGTDGGAMTTNGEVVNDYVTYTWSTDAPFSGSFKISDANWGTNFGGADINGNGEYTVYQGGNNMSMSFDKVDLTFMLPAVAGLDAKLTVNGMTYATRKPFAYNMVGTAGENDQYTITFTATGAADKAIVTLKDEEGNAVATTELAGVAAGENTVVVETADLAEGSYTWTVSLVATNDLTAPEMAYQAPEEWMNYPSLAAGGAPLTGSVVFMRDVEYDAYGMMVVGYGKAGGYAVYNQEGELQGNGRYQTGASVLNAGNGSSTTRGDCLRGTAVFGDWSDKASGAWVFDPMNPETPIFNMMMPEGATQAGDGTITYNGVAIGSGTPCVAFQGYGDDTKMFSFDEDIYSNTLVRYNLGTADYITAAPEMVLSDYASKMINTNIEVEAITNGFFVSQCRADGNAQGVPGLMYFNNAGTMLWQSPDGMLPSYSSGVAVNATEDMIAVSGYNGQVYICTLAFDEYDEPVINMVNQINLPQPWNYSNRSWMQLTFDAANNLHVFSRTSGGYIVVALPGETASYTPAKAEYVIVKSSALNGVSVDTEAPVQYFNLQGIEMPANALTPGIYVRRQGNATQKVVIR